MAVVIDPGYLIPNSQLGEHVVQDATLVNPSTGYPPTGLAGLGLINESDAWLTGRPYGLPGSATVRYSDGRASMLGAAAIEPGYPVAPGYQFGLVANEIQRSLNDTALLPAKQLLERRGAKPMLAAIGATILFGIIGAITTAGD